MSGFYYRMLEHNVIINFPPQRSSYFSLLSAAALWILGGALLMVVLMAYNASSGGIRWPIPGWPYFGDVAGGVHGIPDD